MKSRFLLFKILFGGFDLQERDHIHDINARRAWIIDQLGALIRNGSIPKNDRWIQSILDWLIVNGLFTIKKKSENSPYRAVRASLSSSDHYFTLLVATHSTHPSFL
jgi:DNA polymerase phi